MSERACLSLLPVHTTVSCHRRHLVPTSQHNLVISPATRTWKTSAAYGLFAASVGAQRRRREMLSRCCRLPSRHVESVKTPSWRKCPEHVFVVRFTAFDTARRSFSLTTWNTFLAFVSIKTCRETSQFSCSSTRLDWQRRVKKREQQRELSRWTL